MNRNELDREIRTRIDRGNMTSDQARLARAIIDVTGVVLDHAQDTAKILEKGSPLTPSHIVRNYGAGGLTFDWVNNALGVAARAAAV